MLHKFVKFCVNRSRLEMEKNPNRLFTFSSQDVPVIIDFVCDNNVDDDDNEERKTDAMSHLFFFLHCHRTQGPSFRLRNKTKPEQDSFTKKDARIIKQD